MKKCFFIVTAVLGSVLSYAQNGFYLQPTLGAGIGRWNYVESYTPVKVKGALVHDEVIYLTYRAGYVVFGTGFGLQLTGTGFADTHMPSEYGDEYISNIVLPLSVGYVIATNKKFDIVPAAGLEGLNSFSSKMVGHDPVFGKIVRKEGTHGWAIAAMAQVNLEFAIAKDTRIVLCPKFDYSLNLNKKAVHPNHFYTCIFNAGIKWGLSRHKEAAPDTK